MTTTTCEYGGKTYERVPGRCKQCPGRKRRDICYGLSECGPLIGEDGKKVTYCWREVKVEKEEKEEREVEHD